MKNNITLINGTAVLDSNIVKDLVQFEKQMRELKEIQDNYKQLIKNEMEEKNILRIIDEVTGLNIVYTGEKEDLEFFNKDKFREENPQFYDKYVTMNGKRSSYITVRIK